MQRVVRAAFLAVFSAFVSCDAIALSLTPEILPASTGELKLGEWNRNFNGGLAIADSFHVPMVVFYGGLSCGKCEMLQRACLTEEFLAWQNANKMVMIFTTDNLYGNAISFAQPVGSDGFPFVAVYWHREGENAPSKNSQYYKAFCGRDGEMLATGGSLASQLLRSIAMVTEGYVYDPAFDEAIAGHAEMVYLKPVTTRLRYDVSAFTSIDMTAVFEPQRVYNVSEAYKITLKKISGKLPPGVKLVCSDGEIRLTGAPKSAGQFPYTFSIQQKRSIVTHEGPPITLDIVVHPANDVASGGNAMLGTAVKATLPLYLPEEGGNALKGVLEFNQSAQNKISAQYVGAGRTKAKFAGSWSSLSAGVANAVLSLRDGSALTLTMGEGGRVSAALKVPAYPEELTTGEALVVGNGDYASAFAGAYTVALPENGAASGYGTGYVVIKKLTANGKVQWTAGLPNGKTLSGNAMLTLDGDGNAVLPVFKFTAQDFLAASLRISPNSSMSDNPQAVADCAGTVSRWGHMAKPESVHDCTAYGSRYDASQSIETACVQQYGTSRLMFSSDTAGFVSGRYGALVSVPSGEVVISAGGISLAAPVADLKLSFAKNTGVYKGSMKVTFASGAATAKFSGVIVPGYKPFAVGAAYFADVADGASAQRGFAVMIDERSE